MRLHVWPALLAALLVAGTVAAQSLRTLPENVTRGVLSHVRENLMTLDGAETKLAPGAQIRGQNNLLVLPATLPKDSLVSYQLDKEGALYRAWILTADEAARPDKNTPAVQGRPIEQVLPQYAPSQPARFGEKPPAPEFPPASTQN
jgi:hypothetical protein